MVDLDQCLLAPPHGGARLQNILAPRHGRARLESILALPYGRARSMHSSSSMSPHGWVGFQNILVLP